MDGGGGGQQSRSKLDIGRTMKMSRKVKSTTRKKGRKMGKGKERGDEKGEKKWVTNMKEGMCVGVQEKQANVRNENNLKYGKWW